MSTSITYDHLAQCWRFEVSGPLDGNTRVRFTGERATREDARAAAKGFELQLERMRGAK